VFLILAPPSFFVIAIDATLLINYAIDQRRSIAEALMKDRSTIVTSVVHTVYTRKLAVLAHPLKPVRK